MTVQFTGTKSTKRMNTSRKLLVFFLIGVPACTLYIFKICYLHFEREMGYSAQCVRWAMTRFHSFGAHFLICRGVLEGVGSLSRLSVLADPAASALSSVVALDVSGGRLSLSPLSQRLKIE